MPYFGRDSSAGQYITKFNCEPMPAPFFKDMEEYNTLYKRIGYIYDVDIPSDKFYRTAISVKPTKRFPDIIQLNPWFGVSQVFKDIIERFEPGVHDFSDPVEVFYKDKRPAEQNYYCFNPRKFLDHTIILEKSRGRRDHENPNRMESSYIDDQLTLNRNVVGSRHFWCAWDYYRHYWFFSDDLWKAFEKAKIKKLDFTRCLIDTP